MTGSNAFGENKGLWEISVNEVSTKNSQFVVKKSGNKRFIVSCFIKLEQVPEIYFEDSEEVLFERLSILCKELLGTHSSIIITDLQTKETISGSIELINDLLYVMNTHGVKSKIESQEIEDFTYSVDYMEKLAITEQNFRNSPNLDEYNFPSKKSYDEYIRVRAKLEWGVMKCFRDGLYGGRQLDDYLESLYSIVDKYLLIYEKSNPYSYSEFRSSLELITNLCKALKNNSEDLKKWANKVIDPDKDKFIEWISAVTYHYHYHNSDMRKEFIQNSSISKIDNMKEIAADILRTYVNPDGESGIVIKVADLFEMDIKTGIRTKEQMERLGFMWELSGFFKTINEFYDHPLISKFSI